MIRVLLIEHQPLARDGLSLLIERESNLTLLRAVASLDHEAPDPAAEPPDAVLMDIDYAELDFLHLTKRLRAAWPDAAIVALSSHWSDELITRSLEADIHGFVLRDDGFATIRDALEQTVAGNRYYTRRVQDRLVVDDGGQTEPSKTRLHLLTQRELQLLRLLASGMSLKRACAAMNVSYKTADKHKVNLMRKLDIHDRVELARYAIREKIVEL